MADEVVADAIVVAGGSSSRMAGEDKLRTMVHGRPLLAWTLGAMSAASLIDRIVVVARADLEGEVKAADWLPTQVAAVVAGGSRRQDSVAAGLRALDGLPALDGAGAPADRIILVHDGARPAASPALFEEVARAAARYGAAIPGLPVAETIKRVAGETVTATVDRTDLVLAQTPQGIRRSVLAEAYRRFDPAGAAEFTDEAALLEACRIAVHVLPGEAGNLKVTVPADIRRFASTIAVDRGGPRVGLGIDRHPFGPGGPLVLGGIAIDGAPRLVGHSDGDVALHAVADALLGAAGMGDLGRLFPADERTPRGVASGKLLAGVVRRLAEQGLVAASVDVTIVAARPRLEGHLDAMAGAIAVALGLPAAGVNVKASTGNLDGSDGAGRSISAEALATVVSAPAAGLEGGSIR